MFLLNPWLKVVVGIRNPPGSHIGVALAVPQAGQRDAKPSSLRTRIPSPVISAARQLKSEQLKESEMETGPPLGIRVHLSATA